MTYVKRSLLYAFIALVLAAPMAAYFWTAREADEVERVIVLNGFDPVIPPKNALVLGSFYYVSIDGRHLQSVCNADASDVEPMLERSPSQVFTGSMRVDARTGMQGEMLHAVKIKAELEDQLTIEYSFKDAQLFELSGENLVAIENDLFERKRCDAAIPEYINNVGLVCQVQSALMATVSYVIKRRDGQKIAAEDIETIKGALEVADDMKGMTVNESTVEGVGLFYGIGFKPKCVTTNSDFAIVYPQTKMDRIVLHARLLLRRMFS